MALFGSSTKKTIGIRNRQVTPKERKTSLNESSAATRRDSKTIVDLSAASNSDSSSSLQQTNPDDQTGILSLKDLNYSNEYVDHEVIPDEAVYKAPIAPSASDKEENVSSSELKKQLISLAQEFRHELDKSERTNRKDEVYEMKKQMDEIRDEMKSQKDEIREMKNQIEKAIKQLTEAIQGSNQV